MSSKEKYFKSKSDYITFNIMNEDVLKRLQKDGKVELPKRKVKIPKDRQWNSKQIHSKLIQGMERGDSVQKIARSMRDVMDGNSKSAIRAARTMVTSAENHGRLDSYKALSDEGLILKKYWEATPDDRTRPSHRDMDGEEQDIDKEFSNGCMYPGEGHGPADEVWNCRCSMATHVLGFKKSGGSMSAVKYLYDDTTHDHQMAEIKSKNKAPTVLKKKSASASASSSKSRSDYADETQKKKKRRRRK